MGRRRILKAGAAMTAALAMSRFNAARAQEGWDDCDNGEGFNVGGRVAMNYDETVSFNAMYDNPPALGRVEYWQPILRDLEDPNSVERRIYYGDVVPIYGAVRAEPPPALQHNDIYYVTDGGYVHSSFVVPVTEDFQEPEPVIGDGFWGEIVVPTSWQHWGPGMRTKRYYDLAWGAVFRVIDREDEDCGRAWYRLLDDANPSHRWWVQASHVRRIADEEFAPISPEVPPEAKRIEVIISHQLLVCLEYDQPVFQTRIASGTTFWGEDGTAYSFHTPWGEHYIQRKTPSRHMSGGESINDFFDLPGVPWCTYFTYKGAAIHGTYWHNDYGHPRSHGCVNVTPDASKWIYRWSYPHADHDENYYWTPDEEREDATRIVVLRDMQDASIS